MREKDIIIRTAVILGLSATLTLTLSTAVRAEVYAYPDKGQSTKQQQRDKQECQKWASQQTGFAPSTTPTERPKLAGPGGGAALGAARGAAEGQAAEGAARGALRGRLLGAIRQRREERADESAAQGGTPTQGQREDYDRAYSACLAGRGYTVR